MCSLLCIAVHKCLSINLLTLSPRLPCSPLRSLLSTSPFPWCSDLTPTLAWQRSQAGSSLLQGHYKEAPLCKGALYQEHNPCDDYLHTILTEPGSLSQKKNLELNSFCLQEARAQCLGLYQCSRRCCYCLRLQNIDGWKSLRFPRDVMGAISLISEASCTGA